MTTRTNILNLLAELNTIHNLNIERVSRYTTDRALATITRATQNGTVHAGISEEGLNTLQQIHPEAFAQQSTRPATSRTRPGIINSMEAMLCQLAGVSFTRHEIHEQLVAMYPDRDPQGLMRTVRTQIPYRMQNERGFVFTRNEDNFTCERVAQ